MSKPVWRKIYAYTVTTIGAVLAATHFAKLHEENRWTGFVLFGIPFVFLFVPLVVFGASIRPAELGLKISQYKDVEVGYGEVRGCYRYVFPPFELVVITTRRRFPLNVLIEGDGVIGRRGTLAEIVRSRMKTKV
jgi:hypothetical protein